ncbi:hypothetical protein [Cytobacillus oceanisediminis]|uniref:hypothetical protein n=1 Tax=Cytobacillus oceanisediminis TaxID=665099 RepID=UPI002495295F|nr:hypothetical protein [Cytobacillus oceanisediminis]
MVHKILLSFIHIFLLMNLIVVNAQTRPNIELLDIEKNEISKTVPTNPKIQFEAEKIIKKIDNVVKKLKPILKIPLEPSHRVENKWIYALIDEMIIIIPKNEKPYLLLFDEENKSYFFTFDSKIDPLLKTLDFSL